MAWKMAVAFASWLNVLIESSHGLCRPSAPHASCAHVTNEDKTGLPSNEAKELEPMMPLALRSASSDM